MASPSSNTVDREDDRNRRQLALIVPLNSVVAASGRDARRSTSFRLPKGCRVEGVFRSGFDKLCGIRKFRSLRAVERQVKGKGVQLSAKPLALTLAITKKRSRHSGSGCRSGF